jgi:hypothetical protein
MNENDLDIKSSVIKGKHKEIIPCNKSGQKQSFEHKILSKNKLKQKGLDLKQWSSER